MSESDSNTHRPTSRLEDVFRDEQNAEQMARVGDSIANSIRDHLRRPSLASLLGNRTIDAPPLTEMPRTQQVPRSTGTGTTYLRHWLFPDGRQVSIEMSSANDIPVQLPPSVMEQFEMLPPGPGSNGRRLSARDAIHPLGSAIQYTNRDLEIYRASRQVSGRAVNDDIRRPPDPVRFNPHLDESWRTDIPTRPDMNFVVPRSFGSQTFDPELINRISAVGGGGSGGVGEGTTTSTWTGAGGGGAGGMRLGMLGTDGSTVTTGYVNASTRTTAPPFNPPAPRAYPIDKNHFIDLLKESLEIKLDVQQCGDNTEITVSLLETTTGSEICSDSITLD